MRNNYFRATSLFPLLARFYFADSWKEIFLIKEYILKKNTHTNAEIKISYTSEMYSLTTARPMLAYSEDLKNFLGTLKTPADAGARSALPLIRVYES